MGGLGLMGRLCGWDRADGGVVAGTSGPRALLLAPWSWRGFGLHHTQMCNSALPVLPLGPCSHSMVHPVPWLWCNQGVVLSSVCLDTSCLRAGKGWGSGAVLSIWAASHDSKWCPWGCVVAPLPHHLPTEAVYLIAYKLVALPSKPQARAVTTSLPVPVCCPSIGEQKHGGSPSIALLPCSISNGREVLSTGPLGLKWGYIPLLQIITLGGAAQKITSFETKGDIVTAYLAGAVAVMVGIYTAGGISGETEEGIPALAIPWH